MLSLGSLASSSLLRLALSLRLWGVVLLLFGGKQVCAQTLSTSTLDGREAFAEDNVISLHGPWDFYWKTLLSPEETPEREPDSIFSRLNYWNHFKDRDGRYFPSAGYASFRMELTGVQADDRDYFMVVPSSSGATRLLVYDPDHKTLLVDKSSGRVDLVKPSISRRSLMVHFNVGNAQRLIIVVQVYSTEFVEGGIPPYSVPSISRGEKSWTKALLLSFVDLLAVGISFTLGLYNALIWFKRRTEIAAFYLALGSIVGCMRLISMAFLTTKIAPDEAVYLLRRLEFIPIMIGPYCILQFHAKVFEWSPLTEQQSRLLNAFTLTLGAIPLFMPGLTFTKGLPLYNSLVIFYCVIAGIILLHAYRKHSNDVVLSFVSSTVLIFFICVDVICVHLLGVVEVQTLPLAISFYYLAQSYIVAHRVEIADRLARELALKNEAIEKSLRFESNERLSLAASVAHRINNPLNYIQISADILKSNMNQIREMFQAIMGPDNSEDPELLRVQLAVKKMFLEVQASFETMDSGVSRAIHAINEIRAISGVDGTAMTDVPLVHIIPSCLKHLREHQSTERCRRLRHHAKIEVGASLLCNEPILKNAVEIILLCALDQSQGDVIIMDKQDQPDSFRILLGGNFTPKLEEQDRLTNRLMHILHVTHLSISCHYSGDYWTFHLSVSKEENTLVA